jgi:ABC-2 type transport system ATP-binding protein
VGDICDRYSFEYRPTGASTDDVIYSEPSVQGNAVITLRKEDEIETPLNLELLFNAVTFGKLNNEK